MEQVEKKKRENRAGQLTQQNESSIQDYIKQQHQNSHCQDSPPQDKVSSHSEKGDLFTILNDENVALKKQVMELKCQLID